jgi:hypothetical protein
MSAVLSYAVLCFALLWLLGCLLDERMNECIAACAEWRFLEQRAL